MDWRTVTLVTAGGNRVVVANSTLAKGNLTIAARAREKASATVPLALRVDIPPEQVRDAVIEAGRAVPNLAEPDGVKCFVTGIGDGTIKYNVVLSVANPGILAGPCDEFLSRFWYLAQRRGPPAHVGRRRRFPSRCGGFAATCAGKRIPSLPSRRLVADSRCARD
jgi:small-conductance mechanosensitive channel